MAKDSLADIINIIIEDLGHLSKNVARGYGAIQPTVRSSKPSLGDSEAQDAGEVKEMVPVMVSRAFLKAKAEDQINEVMKGAGAGSWGKSGFRSKKKKGWKKGSGKGHGSGNAIDSSLITGQGSMIDKAAAIAKVKAHKLPEIDHIHITITEEREISNIIKRLIDEDQINEVMKGAGSGTWGKSGFRSKKRGGWGKNKSNKPDEDTSEFAVDVKQLSVKEKKLYDDLIGPLGNHNLCVAMVVNAVAESKLNYNIAGDCGDYGLKHKNKAVNTKDKGHCCSFGLWQYNICRGLGIELLKANGVNIKNATADEKMAVLSSYEKQVRFMINHVKKKAPYKKEETVGWWIDWFVKKVEKPKDADHSSIKRQAMGRKIAARMSPGSKSKVVKKKTSDDELSLSEPIPRSPLQRH